jgi:predicted nucleic acid-binding protein
LFRRRDQHHREARAWQDYLVRSGALLITTEAICWEWLNAMSSTATSSVAAYGYEQIRLDPRVEVVPWGAELSAGALRLFTDRSDKEWSLTDCLPFVVMVRRNVQQALTADHHFEQAGFRPVLSDTPPG